MVDPGGGGVYRWRPLIKWVWRGYEYLSGTLCHIAWHESSGRPKAMYDPSDPDSATGLFQIYYGAPRFKNPLTNVIEAFRKFKASGYRLQGPWAGCRAFTHAPGAPGCGIY